MKNPAAVALGKLGGSAKTEAKALTSAANGAKGGRPRNFLYSVQVFDHDSESWQHKFNSPMGREEATANAKQLRKWAKDEGTGQKYRIIKVEMTF
jgi:hypothetical protein